jgi:hypothetical protein
MSMTEVFQINNNKIKCDSWDFQNEIHMVDEARTWAEKVFEKDILQDKKVLFKEWDYSKG